MLERTAYPLLFAAAIGSVLVSGVFFAFSTFVMAALGRIAPAAGIAAMQAINVTVINPLFMLVFMGTGFVCVLVAVSTIFGSGASHPALALAGSAVYLVACIGVTMIVNVPLNDALAAAGQSTAEAATLWQRYLVDWTFWNHVRTIASLAAGMLFTLALL